MQTQQGSDELVCLVIAFIDQEDRPEPPSQTCDRQRGGGVFTGTASSVFT